MRFRPTRNLLEGTSSPEGDDSDGSTADCACDRKGVDAQCSEGDEGRRPGDGCERSAEEDGSGCGDLSDVGGGGRTSVAFFFRRVEGRGKISGATPDSFALERVTTPMGK